MSLASTFATLIKSSPHLVRMSFSLLWMYITLGSRVRKAKRGFEKQLILQGMSKDDAKRLSACFDELKNSLVAVVKKGVTGSF